MKNGWPHIYATSRQCSKSRRQDTVRISSAPGERARRRNSHLKIVWVVEFESQDPGFAGEMTITFSLADADGGTEVVVFCGDIPQGVRPEDNEMGCRSSLQKLAALLE